MLVRHGTSLESAKLILSGSKKKVHKTWTVSGDDDMIYLHPDTNDDDLHYVKWASAVSSAKLLSSKAIVIEIEVPDNLLDNDKSCDHIDKTKKTLKIKDFKPEFITNVYILHGYTPLVATSILTQPCHDYLCLSDEVEKVYMDRPDLNWEYTEDYQLVETTIESILKAK